MPKSWVFILFFLSEKSGKALMAATVESPSSSAASLNKHPFFERECRSLISSSYFPTLTSPSSDRRFWSTLRSRFDALIENQKPMIDSHRSLPAQMSAEAMEQARRLKQDTKLLVRGFDSMTHSLALLSNNLDNALQGGRDVARPPTFTEILEATTGNPKFEDDNRQILHNGEEKEVVKRGLKRKLDSSTENENEEEKEDDSPYELGNVKRVKNLATSVATDVATASRELKSVTSELEFLQERCALLEEENSKLRCRLAKEIQLDDDDDLVRLQLEALLAEKSRLANENANLMRENQRLHQLVEYHQLTSQDHSTSYDKLIKEMGHDLSYTAETRDGYHNSAPKTP